MSPDALEERHKKVNGMLGLPPDSKRGSLVGLLKPAKKPRKDKGVPRPKKPAPQAPGALTTAQVLEITRLYAAEMLAVDVSRQAQMEAVILAGKVEEAYNARVAYLEALAKGGA